MKSEYFPGMDEEAIAALTSEQIDKTINLACAEEGIPVFLIEPEEVAPDPPRDVEAYRLGDMYFLRREDAESVCKEINAAPRISYTYDKHYNRDGGYEPCNRGYAVEVERFYSPQTIAQIRTELAVNAAAKQRYDEERKRYDDHTEARGKIVSAVHAEVNAARDWVRQRDRLVALFRKYIGLAEGNHAVALKFLCDAERLSEEEIERLKLRVAFEKLTEATA